MWTLNPQEVGILSEAAKNPPFYPIIVTAVNSGLGQAELLGLRWRDVNLGLAFVSVSQVLYKRSGVCEFKELKANQSRRKVDLTPALALLLRQHRNQTAGFSNAPNGYCQQPLRIHEEKNGASERI